MELCFTNEKKPVKHSAGIACMRKNPYNNQLEVLLIKRRYTYAYAEFMNGSYYPADFRRNSIGETRLINLFSEMTTEDKVLIMGMNFSSMWYHIWMSKTNLVNIIWLNLDLRPHSSQIMESV